MQLSGLSLVRSEEFQRARLNAQAKTVLGVACPCSKVCLLCLVVHHGVWIGYFTLKKSVVLGCEGIVQGRYFVAW